MATTGTSPEDVVREFGQEIAVNKNIVDQCVTICRLYSLSAEQLAAKWEAYAITAKPQDENDELRVPTMEHLTELKRSVQKEFEKRHNAQYGIDPQNSFVQRRLADSPDALPLDAAPMYNKDTLRELLGGGGDFGRTPSSSRARVAPGNKVTPRGGPIGTGSRSSTTETTSYATPTKSSYGSSSTSSRPLPPAPRTSIPSSSSSLLLSSPIGPSQTPQTFRFDDRPNQGKREEIFNPHIPATSPSFPPDASTINPPAEVVLLRKAQPEDLADDMSDDEGLSDSERTARAKARAEVARAPAPRIDPSLEVGYRYMFDKLTDAGVALNERIDQLSTAIRDANPTIEFFAHPAQPHQEPVVTAGRVALDTSNDDPTYLLEASRRVGGGCRVPLDLSALAKGPGFSIFPGQVIAVRGTNPSGRVLAADSIEVPPRPPVPVTSAATLSTMYPEDTRPLRIMVSSGPYTLDESLAYDALEELVKVVCEDKPDAVVFLGPFVDASNALLRRGDVDFTVEEIFRMEISSRLERILSISPRTKICLIPSTDDALSDYLVLPQPPLCAGLTSTETERRRREAGIPRDPRVVLLPNPAQFSVNEVVIAAGTVDVLFHLSTGEVSRSGKQNAVSAPLDTNFPDVGSSSSKPPPTAPLAHQKDRLARLCSHLLHQRSLYPLHPAGGPTQVPTNGLADGVTVTVEAPLPPTNVSAMSLHATPDVMVLPSQLRYFAKDVDGVLCINPGKVCRGKAIGTCAKLSVWPLKVGGVKINSAELPDAMEMDNEHAREDHEVFDHKVAKRTRVEIVKV
ncbi:DNA-directed DNA polymerase alpha subunit pol12 [Gonapodya sp. JEL0774]|nr:DNA-directed DNA polymerase alpha subunit pol12 [Gonapodya sp. JEL0774]